MAQDMFVLSHQESNIYPETLAELCLQPIGQNCAKGDFLQQVNLGNNYLPGHTAAVNKLG